MTIEERNDIVVENMKLVHYIAHKMYIPKDAYFDYEDVVQEGMIGLINAVENFDPKLGFKFSTYATTFIKGYMMRFIRENQNIMKYSRRDIDAYVKILRSGKQASEITNEDLVELGIRQNQLSAVIAMSSERSLDEYVASSKESITILDTIPDKSGEFSTEFLESEMNLIKDKVLKELYPSEIRQDIIDEWYYSKLLGVSAGQVYLARKYNVSQPSVGRIIRKFKDKFLQKLRSSGYEVSEYFEE